ncbi:MAG: aspartate/glutamate racemase family protein, partial [Betaproteobacteria bacterium]|nr:aspartate/glutamate racemase family protein [Betaproteobacteria bacterium]
MHAAASTVSSLAYTSQRVGILMLDTRFPRPPGDIGHPDSFRRYGIEPLYQVVIGASARRVVRQADPSLLAPFIEAGWALVHRGASRVGTSCGFLARFQRELQSALPVPVLSSALLACASADAPGILTFDAESLDDDVLTSAKVPPGTPVQGIAEDSGFYQCIINDDEQLDFDEAERAVVSAALTLVNRHPAVKTIVLECTNLPVHQSAIEAATGR